MLKKLRNLYFVASLVGLMGYLLGLLTAPKSGRELRREMKSTGRKNLSLLEKQLKAQYSDLNLQLQELESRMDVSSKIVTESINKYIVDARILQKKSKHLLSALHDGVASDDELIRVIKELKNLKTSIKKYFKSSVS